jgi:hypothetical protein
MSQVSLKRTGASRAVVGLTGDEAADAIRRPRPGDLTLRVFSLVPRATDMALRSRRSGNESRARKVASAPVRSPGPSSAPVLPSAGGLPKRRCLPGSRRSGTTTGDRTQLRLASAQPGQATGALALYRGSQPLVYQSGPLPYAGKPPGFVEQFVVQIDGGSHALTSLAGVQNIHRLMSVVVHQPRDTIHRTSRKRC